MPETTSSEAAATAPETQKNGESVPAEWSPWEQLYTRSVEAYLYSIKAWHVQRRAKPAHGNPLQPREPDYFGPEVRIAARMCDLAGSGMTDARYGPRRRGRLFSRMTLDELAAAAQRFGTQETEEERAARRGIAHDQWNELTEAAGAYSVDAMFDLAKLTGAERTVMELVLDGRDQSQIAVATDKALGTIKVLRKRAVDKLKALKPAEVAA